MSLRDMIEAARREAEKAGNLPARAAKGQGDEVGGQSETGAGEKRGGFSRRSASRAKPTREAARGVRGVNSAKVRSGQQSESGRSESEMSREERRELRRRQRDRDDRRESAIQILCRNDPAYRRGSRLWWILVGVCFVLTFGATALSGGEAGSEHPHAFAYVSMIVLAYVVLIAAAIYYLIKVRPIRNSTRDLVGGMSEKKVSQILERDAEEARKRDAAKAEAKAAKKAARKARREQHK